MNMTNEEFDSFMKKISFRKNQTFKADAKNLERIILYVQKMEVTQPAFQIIQYLIKEFGFSVLLCFQKFYHKITKNLKLVDKFKEKLERISALVNCVIKPYRCGELQFYTIAGTAKKGFNVKQKTAQDLMFLQYLDSIRRCIIIRKNKQQLKQSSQLTLQQIETLQQIHKQMAQNKFNPFQRFYLKKLQVKLNNQIIKQKADEQSTQTTLNKTEQQPIEQNNGTIDLKNLKNNTQNTEKRTQTTHKLTQATHKLKNQEKYSTTITDDKLSRNNNQINKKYNNQLSKITNYTQTDTSTYSTKSKKNYQDLDQSQTSFYNGDPSTADSFTVKKSLNNTDNFNLSFQYGPNFSLIPLCCRTYFFDQERILPGEDRRTEYKSYRFPFNPASIQTFKKTICAFLNTTGGEIYIGIKETTNKKYRYVLGNYLTQNDKEQVLKSFRKITQSIYPNITQELQVQFVPVRKSPFPDINLLGQIQTYFYDFSKKGLNLQKCPYRPARYVIRVRVPSGNKDSMYSYIQTQYQLNKNSTANQFIPFRSQNQVLVKQISQQVLKQFKQKLLYYQDNNKYSHVGACCKPELGDPKNQPQPLQEITDAKEIQMVLHTSQTSMRKKTNNSFESTQRQVQIQKTYEESTLSTADTTADTSTITGCGSDSTGTGSTSTGSSGSGGVGFITQEQLHKIFKYPLTFVAYRITKDRLVRCIQKTPAKEYTSIQTFKNQLDPNEQFILIKVNGYSHMQQFLKIKSKIEKHFQRDNVQFIGISKRILLQSSQNRRVVQQLLKKNIHKYVVNNRILQFYSLIVSTSYFMCMRNLGFKVQAIAME